MKNLKIYSIFILAMILCNLLYSQVIQGGGGTSGSYFNNGIGLGPINSTNFTPGSVNNPSGQSTPDGPRNVFWVHGLNGDIGSWSRAATASEYNVAANFPARQLKSISNFSYAQSAGLLDASRQVQEIIKNTKDNSDKDFIIAHSQGGMVSRGLLHLNLCTTPKEKPAFGGLVTFCSPHQGAQLLNGKAEFEVLGEDMCKELNDAKVLSALDFKLLTLPLQRYANKKILASVDNLCEDIKESIFPLVLNKETPNISKDYEVGAPLLKRINDCLDGNNELAKFPKVAFYGVEPTDHLMLRTVLYFTISSQAPDYFQANEDLELVDDFQEHYNKYWSGFLKHKQNYNIYNGLYETGLCYTWLLYFTPPCITLRTLKNKEYDLYQAFLKGANFLDKLDDRYKTIIGTIRFIKTSKMYCVCENGKDYERREISNRNDCPAKKHGPSGLMFCYVETEDTYTRVELDSDGVVLAESAANLPGATFGPQEMWNSSHMQARNDERLRLGLTKLYEGGTDPWFKTDRK